MLRHQRRGAAVAGLAAAALLALSFSDWFGGQGNGGANMWQAFSVADVLAALAIFAGLAQAANAFAIRSIAGTIALSSTSMLIAFVAFIALLTGLLNPPDGAEREPALWLGVAAAAGIWLGGHLGGPRTGRSRALESAQ